MCEVAMCKICVVWDKSGKNPLGNQKTWLLCFIKTVNNMAIVFSNTNVQFFHLVWYIGWQSDNICQFNTFLFSKDFGTDNFKSPNVTSQPITVSIKHAEYMGLLQMSAHDESWGACSDRVCNDRVHLLSSKFGQSKLRNFMHQSQGLGTILTILHPTCV